MSRSGYVASHSFLGVLCSLVLTPVLTAQAGTVKSEQKISETTGGFVGPVDNDDSFGWSQSSLGDLDGDGVDDLAVGAPGDDDGVFNGGAVWILFLNSNGTVKDQRKISATAGGFGGVLDASDFFGQSLAALGDLDHDGSVDLAVGAVGDDDGGNFQGAVWILFLNPDGTVKDQRKISATAGGFGGMLHPVDEFGFSLSSLGDLDGEGPSDLALAVGAVADDDGGTDRGAVWILFLDANGAVTSEQKVSATAGGFMGMLDDNDEFGWSVASLGDLDGDGIGDLAVGAPRDDDLDFDVGAVWVLFLNVDGTVKTAQKISGTAGGFGGDIERSDAFGSSVSSLDDLDGDVLVVGADADDDGSGDAGAVWILFLNSDGTVNNEQKISAVAGGFEGDLGNADYFGVSVTSLGTLDSDPIGDLAVGLWQDDDGGTDAGAVWILFLTGDLYTKYCTANPNSTGAPADLWATGSASAAAGDLALTSVPVPNQSGIFFHGANQSQTPFGNGFMCTTDGIMRGAVIAASGNLATYAYDNSDARHSVAAFVSTTRNFQYWFRDPTGGGAFFNTSDAISIAILP